MSISLTPTELQTIIARAIAEARAAGAPAVPVPGSAASFAQVVAAGPPVAPPLPGPAQMAAPPPPDLEYTLSLIMSWKTMRTYEHPLLWLLIQNLYAEKPENFTILGGIHTTTDGSRTYFSVRGSVATPQQRPLEFTMHIYGALRFSSFRVKSVDVMMFGKVYRDALLVPAEKFDKPDGSVGSGYSFEE